MHMSVWCQLRLLIGVTASLTAGVGCVTSTADAGGTDGITVSALEQSRSNDQVLAVVATPAVGLAADLLRKERWVTRQGSFWDAQRWMAGDFNGDGRKDLAVAFDDGDSDEVSIDVYLSTGAGLVPQRWVTRLGVFGDRQPWLACDFNGDGLSDVAKVYAENSSENALASIDVFLSTGGGFASQRWSIRQGGFWDTQKWLSGDFNSDGRCDLAVVFNEGGRATIDLRLSTGTGFAVQRWATGQGSFWNAQKWLSGDFNGDGRYDVGKAFNDGNFGSIDAHVSTGSSFSIQRWGTRQGNYWDGQKWFAGDFNGDGRSDTAKAFSDGGLSSVDVHVSSGSSFTMQRWVTRQGGFWDAQKWFAGDLTGDHRDEIIVVFGEGGLVSIDVYRM